MRSHVLVITATRADPQGRTLGAWEFELPSRPTPGAWKALALVAAAAAMAAAPFIMGRATHPETGERMAGERPGPSVFYQQESQGIP